MRRISRQLGMSPERERALRMQLDAAGLLHGDPLQAPTREEIGEAMNPPSTSREASHEAQAVSERPRTPIPIPSPTMASSGRFTLYTTTRDQGSGEHGWAYLWTYEGQRPDWSRIRDDHGPGRYRLVDERGCEAAEQVAPLSDLGKRRSGNRPHQDEAEPSVAEAIERALAPIVKAIGPILEDQRRTNDQHRQALERLTERFDRLPAMLQSVASRQPTPLPAPSGPSPMEQIAFKLIDKMADKLFERDEEPEEEDPWLKNFVLGVAGRLMGNQALPAPAVPNDEPRKPDEAPVLEGMTDQIMAELEAMAARHPDYSLEDVIGFGRESGWTAPQLLAQIKRAIAVRAREASRAQTTEPAES